MPCVDVGPGCLSEVGEGLAVACVGDVGLLSSSVLWQAVRGPTASSRPHEGEGDATEWARGEVVHGGLPVDEAPGHSGRAGHQGDRRLARGAIRIET